MFLGRVIGKIWATRKDAALNGVRLLIVEPIDHTHTQTGDAFVAVAVVNASDGEIIYWVGSREAPNALPDAQLCSAHSHC